MNLEELEERFYEGMFEEHTPSGKIGVTSLVYPCIRKAFFEKTIGQFFDIDTAYDFWIGKAIHKMDFLKEGEVDVEWNGIIGRIDELEDGLIVEKKTCKELPNSPYSHHITQVEYYYLLCLKNKRLVKDAYLLYLEKKYPNHKFFKVPLRSPKMIEEEMLERKNRLEEALKTNKMPKRKISWLCKYCPFTKKCFEKVSK
jgi:CRISPR/Cas system-associated exonuclease Cas4 (RecB family)